MGNIIINPTGGGASQIIGQTLGNGNKGPFLQPVDYLSTIPEQIVGLVPLNLCTEEDCRYSIQAQATGFYLPVFANYNNGASYENDVNSFYIKWPGQVPTFIIQQLQDNFFKPTSQNPGTWQNVATIVDNTYGFYTPQGSVPNYPNRALFSVNWGNVYHAFGNGIFRVTVQEQIGTITGTQASVGITISNSGFPQLQQGTLYIGALAFPFNYNGSYTGFLGCLAGLINAQGSYTAIVTGTGLVISGTNYATSNGVVVKIVLTNTSTAFKVESNSTTDIQRYSTTAGAATFVVNPTPFTNIIYNNGSSWSAGAYTAGSDPIQVFSGGVWFQGLALQAGRFVSSSITINLLINSVTRATVTLAGLVYNGNGKATECIFSFPPTDGAGGHPPRLNPGDVVQLECEVNTTLNSNGQLQCIVHGILPSVFMNTSNSITTTTLGTLIGGENGGSVYSCVLATPPFKLWNWDCIKASGTVKFETSFAGTIGDRMVPGNLFDNENAGIYDSIRLPGFFGKWSAKYEEILQEYGFNPSTTFGTITTVRDKQIGKFKLNILPVPAELIRRLSIYGFMPPGLLISDYNFNNADWFLSQYPVKKAGGIEPKYYNTSWFSADQNWKNRRASIKDMDFEEGVQSLIYSYVDLLT